MQLQQAFVAQNFLGVAGNHQFFVGLDDQGANLGTPSGDFHNIFVLLVGVGVLVGIHADAQPIHVVADLGTGVSVILDLMLNKEHTPDAE